MAQTDRHHGVTVKETTQGVRPISDIATNIIGIIATADDADAKALPLDTPVFSTSAASMMRYAGSKGTLSAVLDAIVDQADAPIIIVRVAEAEEEPAQTALCIGTDTAAGKTGLKALAAAKSVVGIEPKIIGAPGLDTQGVTAELVAVAQELNAFAYARAVGATLTEIAAYRANFSQRELMLIENDFLRVNPKDGSIIAAQTIAVALGLRAKIDEQIGWHKTLSNVGVNGVVGIKTPRTFGLTKKNTDANFLNNSEITTLIREDGYRFWGNRTCADDPMFAFESSVRAAQIIKQTIADAQLWAIDRPMLPALLADVLLSANNVLAKYVRAGRLLGAQVFVLPEDNTEADIANGIFNIGYEFTAVPPLENMGIKQVVSSRFIVNLVDRVVSFSKEIRPTTV